MVTGSVVMTLPAGGATVHRTMGGGNIDLCLSMASESLMVMAYKTGRPA